MHKLYTNPNYFLVCYCIVIVRHGTNSFFFIRWSFATSPRTPLMNSNHGEDYLKSANIFVTFALQVVADYVM